MTFDWGRQHFLIWETLFKVLVGALFETKPDHFLKIKVLFQRYAGLFNFRGDAFLKIVGPLFYQSDETFWWSRQFLIFFFRAHVFNSHTLSSALFTKDQDFHLFHVHFLNFRRALFYLFKRFHFLKINIKALSPTSNLHI